MKKSEIGICVCLTLGFALVTGAPGHIHVGGYGEAGFAVQGAIGVALLFAAGWLADRLQGLEESGVVGVTRNDHP